MSNDNFKISNHLNEAILLGNFKTFCYKHSSTKNKHRLRNIIKHSSNRVKTIEELFKYEFNISLNQEEASIMLRLILAYLNKSLYRKKIDESLKKLLIKSQGSHCAICNREITLHDHADHKVPFKYVGDELDNNLQMLCSLCNTRKNASIDYQIKYLLKLI